MTGNVLYIEDEFFFANTISNKLKEAGFSVAVAADGDTALRSLKENAYDVILLDLILPSIGGFEILQQLGSLEKNQTTPVVVLSNLSSESDRKKAKELGAHSYHVKVNSTPNEILSIVAGIVSARKG